MVDIEYANAFCEVLKILKYVDVNDYEKISPELIQTFQTYANWNWNFEYDVNKSFEEQKISKITKAIIANIFKDYWATPYQKERIEAKENYNIKKRELELQEKYNPDNLFKNKNKTITIEENEEINMVKNNLPIEVKKEKFYDK